MFGKVIENLKMKILLFIQEAPMVLQKYIHIGLHLIIENLINYLPVMEFYLIMKVR